MDENKMRRDNFSNFVSHEQLESYQQMVKENTGKTKVVGVGLVLFLLTMFILPWIVSIPLWLLYFFGLALMFSDPLRLMLFTKPLYQYLKHNIPPMSETERIALQAGDVDWDGQLFRGELDWESFMAEARTQLSQEELDFIEHETAQLCDMVNDWDITHQHHDLPPKVWKFIKEKGFLGLIIPKKYGGKEFSALGHSTIITKLASRSISTAVSVMVPNSLGPAELIHCYGTKEQQDYYLPRLADGREIPCFGLTEPRAGSDATALEGTGVVCKGKFKGKTVVGISLNINKRYITLAPIATLLGIAFYLTDPEHLLSEEAERGITLALVPHDLEGVSVGDRHYPLFGSFMNGTIKCENVFIPLDNIIGGAERIGQGWRMIMESLAVGRGISLPALATANAKLAYRMTSIYTRAREQFKLPIGKFEGVAYKLGEIGGYTFLINSARVLTASTIDKNIKPALTSAISKYHMTELGRKVIDRAMDIHGGKGIQLGPTNYLGMAHVMTPISITVEGANILTRNLMIFGQGAMRCHPYLQSEIDLAYSEDVNALQQYDQLLQQHVNYTTSNGFMSFLYGLSAGRLIRVPVHGVTAKYAKQITRMSRAFAFIADFSMIILGGSLKKRENASARLGDVLSHLYLASAALKYYEENAQEGFELYLDWAMQYCFSEIQTAIDDLCFNYPSKMLGILLRFIIFPLGRSYRQPDDKATFALAKHMQEDSAVRDILSRGIYLGHGEQDPTGHMEDLWQQLIKVSPIDVKIKAAIHDGILKSNGDKRALYQQAKDSKVINDAELKQMLEFEKLRDHAMNVDDFTKI